MEKTLKRLQPTMMKALRERYGEAEANDRWTGLESQFSRWLREEGDLGGRKNMMSSNMMLCYAVCAFYEFAKNAGTWTCCLGCAPRTSE